MPFPEENTPNGMALDYDVGHGLPRVGSQKSRKFCEPVVYSKSLTDLCVNYSSFSLVA